MAKPDVATVPAVQMVPALFSDLPGWAGDDQGAALTAFRASCNRLRVIARGTVEAGKEPSAALVALCAEAEQVAVKAAGAARAFFEENFVPHRVAHNLKPGLLTGYYEPEIAGSRRAEGKFRVPVYKRPPDLVNLVDESERGAKGPGLTHARQTAAGVVPFPTRQEIELGALEGQGLELVWLESPVDVFFLQVQGSGKIKFADGSTMRISYDGKNGHPYTSIGKYLIDNQIMPADRVSMRALANWLKADVERGRQVMWQNQSYVFFRTNRGAEAAHALGVWEIPLTPGRSLAVDTAFHAIGLPVYVVAPTLTHVSKGRAFQRLMVAHDVGSAIKGPERGDIYFGSGEAAGKLAGNTKHSGNLFVLLPKAESLNLEQAALSRPTGK